MKNAMIKTVISLVFLIIFNVIFFFDGTDHSDADWCSYGFVTFAYLCLLATPLLAKGAGSAVLEGSLWLRAAFFFFTELVVAVIFMVANSESMKWPLIVQGILLAVFIVMELMSVLANDSTKASVRKQKEESFARQILIDQLQQRARDIKDAEVRPVLNRCLDALSNCPIQTYTEAIEADLALSNAVNNLCSITSDGNVSQIKSAADKVLRAVQDRNLIIRRCRMK